jgi:hypothetical protein
MTIKVVPVVTKLNGRDFHVEGQFDLLNASTDQWLGWVGCTGENESLTLMSTGAPLTDTERRALACAASCELREHVYAGDP